MSRPTDHITAAAAAAEAESKNQQQRRRQRSDSPPALPEQPFTDTQIKQIFGANADIDSDTGNYLLSVIHYRRETGSLAEHGVGPTIHEVWSEEMGQRGLKWLRERYPLDEEAAAADWAEHEAAKLEDNMYIKRGQQLGLYKRDKDSEVDTEKDDTGWRDIVYGKSGLDMIREENIARRAEKHRQKEEEERREEQRQRANAQLELAQAESARKLGRRRDGRPLPKNQKRSGESDALVGTEKESAWDYWRRRAVVLDSPTPPRLSTMERIGPTTLVTLLTVAACILFASIYTPPDRDSRWFPDVPPAIATALGLTAIHVLVFLAWRGLGPAWRFLNMYFVHVPGYPFAMSTIGSVFSHQELAHLAVNSLWLGTVCVQLHELIGRGNFLAVYVSSGVIGVWASMVWHVSRGVLITSSLGASGAIYGCISALCLLLPNQRIDMWIPFTNWDWGIPSIPVLVILALYEAFGLFRLSSRTSVDHGAHIGGMVTGIVGAQLIRWQVAHRATKAEEMRQEKGAFGGNAPWRQSKAEGVKPEETD
ncbi:rhomboid-domain-containing protein [Rhizodiscina lignyota]|uniref:Rhomboid-domain-containing protein n=1 Tax=Rhizodiscina lignyota TaxID=1504668 RepID=A0A9P4I7E5_9PEZI|nr:rhomboid-domain-containing protein [Rhizodiscina lignyota]